MYAIRRVRDAFRERGALSDPTEIGQNLKEAHKFLDVIKRQVTFGCFFFQMTSWSGMGRFLKNHRFQFLYSSKSFTFDYHYQFFF